MNLISKLVTKQKLQFNFGLMAFLLSLVSAYIFVYLKSIPVSKEKYILLTIRTKKRKRKQK